jgi:hypothetical protein
MNITKPGTKPLVTISANESNCKPNGLDTLNNRAKNPSKKSKNIPKLTKKNAISKFKSMAKTKAIQPENKLSNVMRFGMCFLIFIGCKF